MSANGRLTPSRYLYDIDRLVFVASAVELPELQFFATAIEREPDLIVEIGSTGGIRPRAQRTLARRGEKITYHEHLGSLGANFEVHLGTPIRVVAGPLLMVSRHVLYTNIIEALLRFILVAKDHMLLHSACIGLGGQGIMLSAETDTGKTTTILKLLSERPGTFYSDDMTIIDAHGRASRYPKPLTISAHTLRAVDYTRLRPRQRAALTVQSRVHSRSSRGAAQRMARSNLPIMGINAAVQAAVPPPKYMVTELVDTTIGDSILVDRLYFVERGTSAPPAPVGTEEAIVQLLANTEDAYGFPPYAQLAPELVIDGLTYDELRKRERAILESAIRDVPTLRLSSSDFGWASWITRDLDSPAEVDGRTPLSA